MFPFFVFFNVSQAVFPFSVFPPMYHSLFSPWLCFPQGITVFSLAVFPWRYLRPCFPLVITVFLLFVFPFRLCFSSGIRDCVSLGCVSLKVSHFVFLFRHHSLFSPWLCFPQGITVCVSLQASQPVFPLAVFPSRYHSLCFSQCITVFLLAVFRYRYHGLCLPTSPYRLENVSRRETRRLNYGCNSSATRVNAAPPPPPGKW